MRAMYAHLGTEILYTEVGFIHMLFNNGDGLRDEHLIQRSYRYLRRFDIDLRGKTMVVMPGSFDNVMYTLKDLIMKNDAIVQQSAGTAFDMWQKLAFTLVLVASFVILYQNRTFSKMVGNLRFYGKMSLTNYITQSIIGAAIYFPFGLYLAPYCGYTVSLLIGLFTFLLQVLFCKWWLGKHKQGPLEYIWHKWTWIGTDK